MKIFCSAVIFVFCIVGVATAGPFTDDLSKCMVIKTTKPDRDLLILWLFSAMSSHPDVEGVTNITPEKKHELKDKTADLLMELLTVRCAQECMQAIEYEGEEAFTASFGVLGEVAMHGLMTHPDVVQYFNGLETYFEEKFKQISNEKGDQL